MPYISNNLILMFYEHNEIFLKINLFLIETLYGNFLNFADCVFFLKILPENQNFYKIKLTKNIYNGN